jgi:hypothetical protein
MVVSRWPTSNKFKFIWSYSLSIFLVAHGPCNECSSYTTLLFCTKFILLKHCKNNIFFMFHRYFFCLRN